MDLYLVAKFRANQLGQPALGQVVQPMVVPFQMLRQLPGQPAPFASVVKDAKKTEGLITAWRKDEKLWLELKRREGRRTHKRRVRLAKADAAELFGRAGAVAGAGLSGVFTQDEAAREIAAYCASLAEPLAISCLVSYRRLSFQDERGELRVTLDTELAYFAEPEGVWSSHAPLLRGACLTFSSSRWPFWPPAFSWPPAARPGF